jgi:hypothetical protein
MSSFYIFASDRIEGVSKELYDFVPEFDKIEYRNLEDAKKYCDDYLANYKSIFYKKIEKLQLNSNDINVENSVWAYGRPAPTDKKFFCKINLKSNIATAEFSYIHTEIMSRLARNQFIENIDLDPKKLVIYAEKLRCYSPTALGFCADIVVLSIH